MARRVYGICTSMEHPTDMYPTLQETKSDHLESIGAICGYKYRKQSYQTILSKFMSRAIFGSTIWIYPKCASMSKWLSAAESAIPSTTIPTTVTIENAITRQLTISGGPDEAVSNK
ncbi:hypothetical protein CR513_03281, partial [Mucuna pruriens]